MKQTIRTLLIFYFSFFTFHFASAQLLEKETVFTYADTLRGTNNEYRNWWDVMKYDLNIKFNLLDSTINGYNEITIKTIKKSRHQMQIDLQDPLVLDSVAYVSKFENGTIPTTIKNFEKNNNAYFFPFKQDFRQPVTKLKIYYHGKPKQAINAPWDGGLVYTKDKNNNPWISIACQGLGASVWFPCKDYQGDEPDKGVSITLNIPDTLTAVSNGRLTDSSNNNGTKTYRWQVESPINTYNIIPYIGKYTHFGETYNGEKGKLDMDYWVLEENISKAKKHFIDATRTMKALEYWFGPYPFYKDGYKLVDAPYLGMEHQSAVAYGNEYKMGYLGKDRSGTGWGLKWDFIIVHESGHEWFGNNITTKDIADMWVHEGFTVYSEVLFTEYYYGKEAANEYCIGLRKNIQNDIPIIGPYGVNKEGSGDMYDKGANMIHTIRQIINNDSLFRKILRNLNKTFYHQTVNTTQIEEYISKESSIDFSKVFDQYLRTIKIPILEYKMNGDNLSYRWTNCVAGFNMPVHSFVYNNKKEHIMLKPTENWQTKKLGGNFSKKKFNVSPNFYINTKKVD